MSGTSQTQQQPAAGWNPDPHRATYQRWWDGTQWTNHVAPAHIEGRHQEEMRWFLPVDRPVSAIAAGYLGLFSLLPNPITPVPAVICGAVALKTLKQRPEMTGHGRAWFGIVVGAIDIVLIAAIVLLTVLNPRP